MPPAIISGWTGDVVVLDIGTGSVRAALVGPEGVMRGLVAKTHTTDYPKHGWVEQRPADWWQSTIRVLSAVMKFARTNDRKIAAISCCAQMHAPVLLDQNGDLVRETVPLWNDKRAAKISDTLRSRTDLHTVSGNPPTPAWPGLKLAWMRQHMPDLIDPSHTVLMSKDYINYRLCGARAMDMTESGSSYMFDAHQRDWSPALLEALDLPREILPELVEPFQVIGHVSRSASDETGLPIALPVIAGMGDYPAALLGAGVDPEIEACDITGTSYLLTCFDKIPAIDPNIMNVATADGEWGAFAVVDAAGDSVRWAQSLFSGGRDSFAEMANAARNADRGSSGLIYLPYLTGERLGQGSASRGAFLGLTASHHAPEIYRSIFEGVSYAMREAAAPIFEKTKRPAGIVVAAGGSRDTQWLQIKADILNLPLFPTLEAESGLLGCAAVARVALDQCDSPNQAARLMSRRRDPVIPQPDAVAEYQESYRIFSAARKAIAPVNHEISGRLRAC